MARWDLLSACSGCGEGASLGQSADFGLSQGCDKDARSRNLVLCVAPCVAPWNMLLLESRGAHGGRLDPLLRLRARLIISATT